MKIGMPLITSKLLKLLYYKKPTNYKLMNLQIPRQTIPRSAMKHRIIPSIICDFICGVFLPVDNQPSSIIKYP